MKFEEWYESFVKDYSKMSIMSFHDILFAAFAEGLVQGIEKYSPEDAKKERWSLNNIQDKRDDPDYEDGKNWVDDSTSFLKNMSTEKEIQDEQK